jgi:hypothetical protein
VQDKQTTQPKRQTEAKGLSFDELEAQGVGGLLPNRTEMKRKRKRGRGSSGQACNGIAGCVGIDIL